MWTRVIEIAGFDVAEKIRQEFAGEEIRVPSKLPVTYIVPLVKEELKQGNTYEHIAKNYKLSVKTVRRYEQWTVKEGKLVSPDGHTYFLKEDPI